MLRRFDLCWCTIELIGLLILSCHCHCLTILIYLSCFPSPMFSLSPDPLSWQGFPGLLSFSFLEFHFDFFNIFFYLILNYSLISCVDFFISFSCLCVFTAGIPFPLDLQYFPYWETYPLRAVILKHPCSEIQIQLLHHSE